MESNPVDREVNNRVKKELSRSFEISTPANKEMNVNPKTATPGTKFSREKIPSVPINFFCINESKISITTGSPKPKSIINRSLNISSLLRSAKAVPIIIHHPHLQMKETLPLSKFLQFLF